MLTAGSDTLVDLTGADTEITDDLKKLDDLNWEKASMWEKVQSGLARGLENVAEFLGAEKTANAARVERIKGETKYLDEKHEDIIFSLVHDGQKYKIFVFIQPKISNLNWSENKGQWKAVDLENT